MPYQLVDQYPHLRAFLGGWFHQDFDIVAQSLEDIVNSYRESAPQAEALAVRTDIDAFLQEQSGDLDEAFLRIFHPDVEPGGWGMTTRQWLMQIRDLM